MQQGTINTLFNTIKNVTQDVYDGLGFIAPLTLLWHLAESKDIPRTDNVVVYSHLIVDQDGEDEYGDRIKYRARGAIIQELSFPKRDSFFHDGIRFATTLQDRWRKTRDVSISYYSPMITPSSVQPTQSFLQWDLKVVYDVFETI